MMIRKLDKIEKEMGYCEIKLEKERRLRRQVDYLRAELAVLGDFERAQSSGTTSLHELPFAEWGRHITLEREVRSRPGPTYGRAKQQFIVAGVLDMVRQEKDLLEREIRETESKFDSFAGFEEKREVLEQEKKAALSRVSPQIVSKLRHLSDEFKKTEEHWNSLTEDAIHLDEAVFFLTRHVDYYKSARSFVVAAKGSFDIENWIEDRYVGNLFRHSNIGRAKEMVDGAHRNLKLAQKELVCVVNRGFAIDPYEPRLVRFLEALFDDIFLDGRLERTIAVVEDTIEASERCLGEGQRCRDDLHEELERTEQERDDLFQRLGGERRGNRVPMS
ncbi:MAG TPA: hypothetical protein VK116_04965 [Planctomycetota bacterium]|nr:hypothetical protein [Planctomycetota bacterium]